jgi:hypothetical protein
MSKYYWSDDDTVYLTDDAADVWVYLGPDGTYEWGNAVGVSSSAKLPPEIQTLEQAKAYIETLVRMGAL